MLSAWLYQGMHNRAELSALVKGRAAWSAIHAIPGTLEVTLAEIFMPHCNDRLEAGRHHLLAEISGSADEAETDESSALRPQAGAGTRTAHRSVVPANFHRRPDSASAAAGDDRTLVGPPRSSAKPSGWARSKQLTAGARCGVRQWFRQRPLPSLERLTLGCPGRGVHPPGRSRSTRRPHPGAMGTRPTTRQSHDRCAVSEVQRTSRLQSLQCLLEPAPHAVPESTGGVGDRDERGLRQLFVAWP